MKRLNCYFAAWKAYADDSALWMACRKSQWNEGKPFILPIRLLGTFIVWLGAVIWLIGHFLKFSTWPHWIYCTRLKGDCMEYVPFENKTKRSFPPLLFEGERRKAKTEEHDDDHD